MIRTLHEQIQSGALSAAELAETYFKRIEEKNPALNAYLSVRREQALREAESVDERRKRGERLALLSGIPGAIKDNLGIAGEATTAGSKSLEGFLSPSTATAVSRLMEAGAVCLGKTNLDEFAMGSSTENSAFGPTKNPHDETRVPGGSSGGSAAAVAGELAVFALGSDTGGSIRQPASFCGVVGLKPTYGRVSRSGLIAMSSSLDAVGPFARSVEDVAIVLSAIAGRDPLDATSAEMPAGKPFEDYLPGGIAGLKIGLPEEYFSDDLDPAIRALTDAAAERFTALGASVVPLSLPHARLALPAYYIIMPAEVSSNLARFDGIRYGRQPEKTGEFADDPLFDRYLAGRAEGFGHEVKKRILLGTHALSSGYYDAYYKKASAVRELIRDDFRTAFESVDLIFSPTAPETAFPLGAKSADPLTMYYSDIFTVGANLAGIPAVSFPIGELAGLPLGGQLMGRWFDEETLLRAAHAYEQSSQNR